MGLRSIGEAVLNAGAVFDNAVRPEIILSDACLPL